MTGDAAVTSVVLDAGGRIAQDVYCIQCGYNLHSLLPTQACPECNEPIEMSLRGDWLRFANPAWLAKVVIGMRFVAAGIAVRLALPWILDLLRLGLLNGQAGHWLAHLPGEVLFLIGLWLVTLPEPRLLYREQAVDARRLARVLLIGYSLLKSGMAALGMRASPQLVALAVVLGVMHTAGWVCLYVYLVRLARRLPASGLIRFAWTVCGITAITDAASLCIVVILCLTGNTPIVRTSGWISLITAWSLAMRGVALLSLILAAVYCRRLRQAWEQSSPTGLKTTAELTSGSSFWRHWWD